MSNDDSFITEVTDELRRDRLFALMRRYGWIAVLLIILLVAGAAAFEWRRASAQAEAQATGDALLAALQTGSAEERLAGLAEVNVEGANRGALVALMTAGAEAEAGDASAAVERLDAIIDNQDVSVIYRDLARLKSVFIGSEILPPEAKLERLSPLTAPGNGYRLLALEQRAFAEIESGDTAAAIETLEGLLGDADVTQDLRVRASQLIVALGGALADG